MTAAPPNLAAEVIALHRSLFGGLPDPLIIERYETAHRKLFPADSGSPLLERIVSRNLDVEAVEFALRRRRAGAELTRKMQILCYLVEVRAPYQHHFVSAQPARAKAAIELTAAAVRTAWKLAKGEYLVHRHGLL